ncbi:hypothetical protein BN927_02223 [Lactococcus lactis subsp. lactis Dephy 1]|uniref:hypothetical protein n=1 Tax=Lactococcus lactis TaxID=1358 RepID=UPI0003B8C73F|nr:hypothetical protein [Lactococcus lactis]CDI47156.1 hypothetical protein BN927_02223 [Lactococcus lactis subsp. lactis Dephy 1]
MKSLLEKSINKWWVRHIIFGVFALFLFLPFLINGELITWADSQFHLTRIYEIVQQQDHGQFFPDIIKYSGLQNWGYGLNFFYPSYVLLPLVFLWRLLDNPVLAIIIFDIFIVYFALVMNYRIFRKASDNISLSFFVSFFYVLTASAGKMPVSASSAMNVPIVGIEMLNQLTSNIVFLFAPIVLISFYQIIFKKDKTFWRSAAIFSALSVMLSIPATLGLVIIIFGMFVIGVFNKKISFRVFLTLLGTAIATICLSALFIIPFLEQRLGSQWASLPNRQTLWGKSFFDIVIKNIFDFSDILSIFVIFTFILLLIYKKFDKNYKLLAAGYLISLLFLHSSVFPWWIIQNLFSATLQYTSRWEFIPKLLGSIFIARAMLDIAKERPKIVITLSSLTLFFSVLGMYGNTISTYFPVLPVDQIGKTKPESGNRVESFYPTKNLVRTGGVFFRVNKNSVNTILETNFVSRKELGLKPDAPLFSSFAFSDYRLKGQYKNHRDIYEKSLVKFDGKLHQNLTSIQGENLVISNLPVKELKVQAPVTYLKGFKAFDSNGNQLMSYKNNIGFLEIKTKGSDEINIVYEKTFLHKLSIIISIISWLILIFGIFLSKINKIIKGDRSAKTINRHTSLQRRRSNRNIRQRSK